MKLGQHTIIVNRSSGPQESPAFFESLSEQGIPGFYYSCTSCGQPRSVQFSFVIKQCSASTLHF